MLTDLQHWCTLYGQRLLPHEVEHLCHLGLGLIVALIVYRLAKMIEHHANEYSDREAIEVDWIAAKTADRDSLLAYEMYHDEKDKA